MKKLYKHNLRLRTKAPKIISPKKGKGKKYNRQKDNPKIVQ